MAYITRREGCPLGEVETWVFDLDNTLYPTSCGLFTQVQERMNHYICTRLAVTQEEAAILRAQYFREHGTTMNGLMVVNRIDPHEFLDFVHDIDHSVVPANPELVAALSGLTGASWSIPTAPSACRKPAYASRHRAFVRRHLRHRCLGFRARSRP
jgi:pyrimidine 5'-nucleotidase